MYSYKLCKDKRRNKLVVFLCQGSDCSNRADTLSFFYRASQLPKPKYLHRKYLFLNRIYSYNKFLCVLLFIPTQQEHQNRTNHPGVNPLFGWSDKKNEREISSTTNSECIAKENDEYMFLNTPYSLIRRRNICFPLIYCRLGWRVCVCVSKHITLCYAVNNRTQHFLQNTAINS